MTEKSIAERKQLREVAGLYGVQPSYYGMFNRLNQPPPEALLAVLRMPGAPVEKMSDLVGAIRVRRQFLLQRTSASVIVIWQGLTECLRLGAPSSWAQSAVHCMVGVRERRDVDEMFDPGCQMAARRAPATRSFYWSTWEILGSNRCRRMCRAPGKYGPTGNARRAIPWSKSTSSAPCAKR